jgi:tripartite ATP-independent transporter DctM subunit
MTPEGVALLGLIALFALLMSGLPIGAALGLVGTLGLSVVISPEAAVIKAGVASFETISKYELGVLPLFVLMAHVAFSAGGTRDFFDVAAKFVGHRPGGLALASIAGSAGFGAISGSSLATAATVGLVALPEMRRHHYSPALATGALAAGGTLGSMIPPSGALIVFGVIAEQSIGRLFIAAIVPGLTQALLYMATIVVLCRLRPALGPPTSRATWREGLRSLGSIGDVSLLVLVVIGGLAAGWFTPTEAASVGALGALALSAWRRNLSAMTFRAALEETLRTTGMIYVVIIGAVIFSTFISVTGVTTAISAWVGAMQAGRVAALAAMAIVLLILGTFLDGLALMLLTTPIFLPIAVDLGMSPIWFGIFLVRTMEIGFVTPPVGMNVYVIHGIARDIPLSTIFRGICPFLAADLLHLALLVAFPALALALPALLGT